MRAEATCAIFFLVISVFTLPAAQPVALECNFTIHPEGDDSNSCGLDDPCRTFARLAQFGGILCVQPGYYAESTCGSSKMIPLYGNWIDLDGFHS